MVGLGAGFLSLWLLNVFTRPSELSLGESYIFGDFDIAGDIEASSN